MSGIDTLTLGWIEGGDTEIASFLRNTGGLVNIRDSSLAPTPGDTLIAIDAQNAAWGPIPSGTQDLQSVLSYGNSTGAFDVIAQQKIRMPNAVATNSTSLLNITTGAGAPTSIGVQEGSLYYDSTGNTMYLYDTVSGWISTYAGVGATPAWSTTLGISNVSGAHDVVVQQKLRMPNAVATNSTALLNITTGAGAPTSAGVNEGSLYYDSVGNAMYVYDTVSGWISPVPAAAVPTLAQVLTAGSTASLGQTISMNAGMKLAQAGILDTNSNNVLGIINNVVGTNAYTRISAGAANAAISTVNTVAPASDVSLIVTPQNNGSVNFTTSATAQVYTNSYYASNKQTRVGGNKFTAISTPPGADPIQTVLAAGFVRLVMNGIAFDDNVTGGSFISLANNWLVLPAGTDTWMISAAVEAREATNHTNNATLRFRLISDNTVTVSAIATDYVSFPSSQTVFSSNMCVVYGANAAGPNRIFVDFVNQANQSVEILTYRLRAVRIN